GKQRFNKLCVASGGVMLSSVFIPGVDDWPPSDTTHKRRCGFQVHPLRDGFLRRVAACTALCPVAGGGESGQVDPAPRHSARAPTTPRLGGGERSRPSGGLGSP